MEQFFVSRIHRYYEVEWPSAAKLESRSRRRWPLLIALHRYQGDKDSMMRVARRISGGSMVVMSLQGHNQFFIKYGTDDLTDPKTYRAGFGWGTSYRMGDSINVHHSGIHALIRLAVRRYHADPRQVFLSAFSQACSLSAFARGFG